MKRTLYHILGVDSKASFQEIRLAYQTRLDELATTPTFDPTARSLLGEAYYTLSSPSSRSIYDASLLNAVARASKPRGASDARSSGPAWLLLCVILLVVAGIVWTLWSSARSPLPLPASVGAVSPQAIEKAALPAEPDPSSSANTSDAVLDAPTTTTRSAEDVFSHVSPSIARVVATERSNRTQSLGSGVVIAGGTVVTNCHVVARAGAITARVGTDTYEATVMVADEELDLCSLSVPGLPAPAVEIGSVGSLRTGQRVYAIGAPYGLDLTISEGIVSSLRDVSAGTVIQTTAAVSPGSSGGGLFNLSGQLVGIVTFQHRYGQNLNFAHPADWIAKMQTRASSLKAATPSPRPYTPDPIAAPTVPRMGDSPEVLIVGSWWCIGGVSFPNGEFHFGRDGTFTATLPRSGDSGSYSVIGGKFVNFVDVRGRRFSLAIQNITTTILVLKKADYSDWLTCSRK